MTQRQRVGRATRLGAVLVAGLLLGWAGLPRSAEASGITLGRFGGLYGHPNADGGLALYWNPARLAVGTGGWVSLDGTLVYRIATYDRVIDPATSSEAELQVNAGEGTLSNAAVLPMGSVGYSIGFDRLNLAFGLGAYPAYGGAADWDKQLDAPAAYPGALDGPQRWSTIAATFAILHYTATVSASLPDVGISLGVGVAYVDAELNTARARNLNRTDDLVDVDGQLLEGRVHFRGEDSAVTFTVGASYEHENVRASAVYRAGYDLRLVGPARQAYATNQPTVVDAFVEFPLPHVFQTALTVTLGRLVLTGVTDFTTWSNIQANDVLVEETRERLLLIPRDLNNTFSARGIIGWQFSEAFRLSGMLGVDPSAVPPETVDSSLFDALKLQVGLGIRYDRDRFSLLTSYVHDIFFQVETSDNRHEPAQNGTYSDTRGFLNLSLEARF